MLKTVDELPPFNCLLNFFFFLMKCQFFLLIINHVVAFFSLDFEIGYSLSWNYRNIPVFRPDVECTNGIIHVIDHPFLVDSDVHVSGGSRHTSSKTTMILIGNAIMVFIAKMLV